MDDDQTIIDAVLRGDLNRFEELIDRHHESVWRSIAAFGLDRETIRDLVQQTFVDGYGQLDRFVAGADCGAWLRGIAKNGARKELRRRNCRYRHQERLRQHLLLRGQQSSQEEDARLAALRRCREQLPEHGRRALTAFYADGQALDHIASLLGRSMQATRQLLYRCRQALKRCVEEQSEAQR